MPATAPSLETYTQERPRLRMLAYRLLGSFSDAEDVLQDAWLKWAAADSDGQAVRSPQALLTTIVTRLALDRLRARKRAATEYVGHWLPEPDLTPLPSPVGLTAPRRADDRGEHLSYAFLVVLERLTPEQRAAFLLRDVLDMDYAEIAPILRSTPAACRQLVHRARLKVGTEPATVSPVQARTIGHLTQEFVRAVDAADYDALIRLFTGDAVLLSDGGGKVIAALNTIHGPDAITRFTLGVSRKAGAGARVIPCLINGAPGAVVVRPGRTDIIGFTAQDDRLRAVYMIANPDKQTTLSALPGLLN
ncbi:RNA polymerase sigma factor SigJ [Novispirillum itersonii]|uniref:RNA polymerase sigma factor SigJ n=1 Tax=Novispirillum itersonii TaxID=189 RepID=UPI00036710D7|nr:RNA polymerase sigma factor SigJ [Novispirillum itersonii]